jgi:hypothetical protein
MMRTRCGYLSDRRGRIDLLEVHEEKHGGAPDDGPISFCRQRRALKVAINPSQMFAFR